MRKCKPLVVFLLVLSLVAGMITGCGQNAKSTGDTAGTAVTESSSNQSQESKEEDRPNVELEIVSSQPEYLEQETEIWKIYEQENPNVKVKLISVNEDQTTALNARIAAGNPPDIQSLTQPVSKDNYKNYLNLLEIDFPYWDKMTYDAKNFFKSLSGIQEDYVPELTINFGFVPTFIYYEDEMVNSGLDPKGVKTFDDLDKFMAGMKAYIDKDKKYEYVLDIGWHPVFVGTIMPTIWASSMGDMQQLEELWNGRIKWTDIGKNPLVPFFQKLKDYYDKGYLPKKWWTRNWETDYEASFIGKKSILAYHGPWLWDKVLQNNPSAKLSGFPLPANKSGGITTFPMTAEGTAMFVANKKKDNFNECVRAFNWFCSPEIVKMRTGITNLIPAMDLKDVGGASLKGPQFTSVVKPVLDGAFGNVKFDGAQWPSFKVSKYEIPGKPPVMEDDSMAAVFGKYFEGKLTIEDFMSQIQKRFDVKYKFN